MKCKFCEWEKHYKKLYENEYVVAVWGSPYVRGHVKVILKNHYSDLTEVPAKELHALMDAWKIVGKAIEEVIHPDIINWQINGNWVRHVHGHIYPRWQTDPDWGEPLKLPTKEQDANKEFFHKELSPEDIRRIEDHIFHKN
ncbi:HIT family protein [Candidatus Woesearchaeota archaeon]|nr:HIT family protein [Candidatus Woesearchaeota archaeon]